MATLYTQADRNVRLTWVYITGFLVFLFTGVMVPPDQVIGGEAWFPPSWLQALQYGLASELSYHFVLPPERVAMLNQKAEREFLLAKGYPKKEAETCGVKSLY